MYKFIKEKTYLNWDEKHNNKIYGNYYDTKAMKGLYVFIIFCISIVISFVSQIVSAIPIFIMTMFNFAKKVSTGSNPFDGLDQFTSSLYTNPINTSLFTLVLSTGITIGVILFYTRVIEKNKIGFIGLSGKFRKNLKKYLIGFSISVGFQLIYLGVLYISGNIVRLESSTNFPYALGYMAIPFVIIMLIGWIVQGASEEIFSRGWMSKALSKNINLGWVMILQSLLFMLLHIFNSNLSIIALSNLFLYGIFIFLYALNDGGLWGAFGNHTGWNFFMGNVLGFPVSGSYIGGVSIFAFKYKGPTYITGGSFGPEGGIIETTILLVGILVLFILLKNKGIIIKGNNKNK